MKNIKIISKSKYKFIEYLIYLQPILIVFSPLLSNSNLALISIFGLYYILKYKPTYFINNLYIKLFFIFWLLLIFSSVISEYKFHSLKSSFFYIKNLFFIIAIYIIAINNKNFLKNFLKLFISVYLFLIIDAFIQIYFGFNIFGYELSKIENGRVSGAFGKELILGSYLTRNLFIVIGIYSLINKGNKFIIFFILITSIIVLFTKERASFFLLVFGVMIYVIFSNNMSKKIKFFFTVTFVGLLLLISLNINHIYSRMFIETKSNLLSNNNIYFFPEGHARHFITAYKIYEQNKIFGIGPNNFRKVCEKDEYKILGGCTTHPHNFYIQILAEVGIAGLIFIIIFFITILTNLFKNINSKHNRNKEFQLCILIALLINFWPITTSGNFFGSSLSNIYIFPFAFLMLFKKISLKSR